MGSWFEDDLQFIQIGIPKEPRNNLINEEEDDGEWVLINLGSKPQPLDGEDNERTDSISNLSS